MKRRHYLRFNVPRTEGPRFRKLMEDLNCSDMWEEPHNEKARPHLNHLFDETDPRLGALKGLLEEEGITWFERVDAVYSETELRTAPLLRLIIRRDILEGGGCEHGTVFQLSTGCPACGTGSVQVTPAMLTNNDVRNPPQLVEAGNGLVLVGARVAGALRDECVTGLELRQALLERTLEPAPLWQLIPECTMPKMSARTRGVRRSTRSPCALCHREMYGDMLEEPGQIKYDGDDVKTELLPDVVQTWECFGKSWVENDPTVVRRIRVAHGLLLVKPRVREILRQLQVRGADFAPIQIE